MDRNEAVLRELNLYPLWVRRDLPAQTSATATVGAIHESPEQSSAMTNDREIDKTTGETTSHLTKLSKNDSQVIGYSHSTKLSKDDSQVAGYRESPLREIDWPELKQQVRDCAICKLRAGCTQTVFGVGDENADWLFVGEGPGEEEDAQGEPFVGQAGRLLDNMLQAIKLKRGKKVYIANVVKCHSPNNRNPDKEEITRCLPYLQRQIALIQPRLIVALGKTASNALLGNNAPLNTLRGKLHDFNGIPLVVTYHPAYLLRSPSEKAKAWQDLCFATDEMNKM